jgi:hypothetical protein
MSFLSDLRPLAAELVDQPLDPTPELAHLTLQATDSSYEVVAIGGSSGLVDIGGSEWLVAERSAFRGTPDAVLGRYRPGLFASKSLQPTILLLSWLSPQFDD